MWGSGQGLRYMAFVLRSPEANDSAHDAAPGDDHNDNDDNDDNDNNDDNDDAAAAADTADNTADDCCRTCPWRRSSTSQTKNFYEAQEDVHCGWVRRQQPASGQAVGCVGGQPACHWQDRRQESVKQR